MENLKITLPEFQTLITENKIKFTPAQQKIVNRLLTGDQLILVNQHHRSGGHYMWVGPDFKMLEDYPEYAGTIYKAFWGIQWTVYKKMGFEIDMSIFRNPINNLAVNY